MEELLKKGKIPQITQLKNSMALCFRDSVF